MAYLGSETREQSACPSGRVSGPASSLVSWSRLLWPGGCPQRRYGCGSQAGAIIGPGYRVRPPHEPTARSTRGPDPGNRIPGRGEQFRPSDL